MDDQNRLWIPGALLGLLYVGFVSYLAFSTGQLPDKVATHFDFTGAPDAWMSRSAHVAFMLGFGFSFPMIVVALSYLARYLPETSFNIPHRDYWLANERRETTYAYLFRHSLWFACLGICFVTGLQYLVVRANIQGRFSNSLLWSLAGCLLATIGVWIALLVQHFRRVA